jgi:hypothetical protein
MTRVTTANPLFRTPGNNNANILNALRKHYKMNELNNNTRAFLRKLLANGNTPNTIKKRFNGFGTLMVAVNRYKQNLTRPTPNPLARINSARPRSNNNKRRRHGGVLGAMGAAGKLVGVLARR